MAAIADFAAPLLSRSASLKLNYHSLFPFTLAYHILPKRGPARKEAFMRVSVLQMILVSWLLIGCSFPVAGAELPRTLDGHFWEEMSKESPPTSKLATITSYMEGYTQGKLKGVQHALKITRAEFKDKLCPKPDAPGCTAYKSADAQAIFKVFLGPQLEADKVLSSRPYIFYLKEVDGFFQTFPLCKRLGIFDVLSDLVEVWEGKKSYKEIGDKCLESPK